MPAVESAAELDDHLGFVNKCVRETIEAEVPKKKPMHRNGRTVSQKTKELYVQRARDYSSGRKITKSDRQTWNRLLGKAGHDDYEACVERYRYVKRIEEADAKGDTDTAEISRCVKALSGTTRHSNPTQPTQNEKKEMIQSPEELGALWQRFLQRKFSATELEQARAEYAELCAPNLDSEEDDLTASEFLEALRRLKIGKATGPDGIPAEVWKSSTVAPRDTLFFFLR